eukprot:Blabericola_migrator_1__7276@NODE_3698_length_1569_cov_66_697736_g2294_i0_p1_GENE_NODE_3698_length_1569_cov_66_697736_g2294_i0NODE_3698_length_1569_cov_66_697736_g2294_i0_p1_ORF_typecomplete_len218_score23_88SurA_N/PF09312_11/16SurA_N/PF09312_11/32SurA_N/PF09312_11/2_7e03_NODE_3698_length_1569_cov_66_697736_g2294_i09151538
MQQAQQSRQVTKDDTRASLLLTGVTMAMWRTDLRHYTTYLTYEGEPPCSNDLVKKGLLKRKARKDELVVTDSSIHQVQGITDLLDLNRYLDIRIAQGMVRTPQSGIKEVVRVLRYFLSLSENQVRASENEAIAVERLQRLVATKIYHLDSLKKNKPWTSGHAFDILFKYRDLHPNAVIREAYDLQEYLKDVSKRYKLSDRVEKCVEK